MSRIKARYVALVCIEMDADENTEGLLPYEEIERNWKTKLNDNVKECLVDEFTYEETGKIEVIQTYCDVWKAEDEE